MEITRIAKLSNGKLVRYDACANNRVVKDYRKVFRYIGKGTIFSINGREQSRGKQYYFWVYRKKYEHLRSGLPCPYPIF